MIVLAMAMLHAATSITGCKAVDGDTLRCGRERVRLLGIDAPEMGRCAPGRRCVRGDPKRSMRSLSDALDPTMTITRVGRDRYGRTLALVQSRKGDLSCWQMRTRNAQYRADWDNGGRVRRTCRALAR